jgi:hypothetical protein
VKKHITLARLVSDVIAVMPPASVDLLLGKSPIFFIYTQIRNKNTAVFKPGHKWKPSCWTISHE